MIRSIAWVLPRPNKSKYIGSFPLHFEKKLVEELRAEHGLPESFLALQPFGGKAEIGIIMDILAKVHPHIVGDAHNLPFKNSSLDLVILDPPYSTDYSKRLYGTGPVHFKKYTAEAVRVLKEDGLLVMYHEKATPRIEGTVLVGRIFMETRVWHKLRCIHIHKKEKQ